MKRYNMLSGLHATRVLEIEATEGEWVKYEDVEQLEKLLQETRMKMTWEEYKVWEPEWSKRVQQALKEK